MNPKKDLIFFSQVWESRLRMEEFQRSGANESQWGSKNFIQIKAIREVTGLWQVSCLMGIISYTYIAFQYIYIH